MSIDKIASKANSPESDRTASLEKWDLSAWSRVDENSPGDVHGLKQIAAQIIKEPNWRVFVPGAKLAAKLPSFVGNILDRFFVRHMTKHWPHKEPMASALVIRSKDGGAFGGICLYQIAYQSYPMTGDFVINGLYLLPELRRDIDTARLMFLNLARRLTTIIDQANDSQFAGEHPISRIIFLMADTKELTALYRLLGAERVTNAPFPLSKGETMMEIPVENLRLFVEGKPIPRHRVEPDQAARS